MKRRKFRFKATDVLLLCFLGAAVAFVWWMLPGRHLAARATELPTRYSGKRFFAEPITTAGVKLNLFPARRFLHALAGNAAARRAARLPIRAIVQLVQLVLATRREIANFPTPF
ncbi:MAG: hypothetical protein AAB676_09690 [Verrucomicrobiota bacterium]